MRKKIALIIRVIIVIFLSIKIYDETGLYTTIAYILISGAIELLALQQNRNMEQISGFLLHNQLVNNIVLRTIKEKPNEKD